MAWPIAPENPAWGLSVWIRSPVGLHVKGGLIVNVSVPVAPATVMLAEPALAIRLAGTCAVSCVALTNVVASGEPFHCTAAPLTKFVPLTVSVNDGLPAVPDAGLSEVIVDEGAVPCPGVSTRTRLLTVSLK